MSSQTPQDADRGIDGPIPDRAQARDLGEIPEYPQAARFEPAAPTNFQRWTGEGSRPVHLVVIHITDGRSAISGPINYFQNQTAGVSAHYVVGPDGEVVQLVAHDNIAWHTSGANRDSIGIEHVARSPGVIDQDDPGFLPTRELYESSARLVRFLCKQLAVPIDRDHVKGNWKIRTTAGAQPTQIWNWDHYMRLLAAPELPERQQPKT